MSGRIHHSFGKGLDAMIDRAEKAEAENERLKAEVRNWEEGFPMCHQGIEGKCSAEQKWKQIIAEKMEWINAQGAEMAKLYDKYHLVVEERDDLRAACGGLSPEAVEWAIRIAAELMAEWEEGSTHADTYYIVEAWWRSCPPEVRAQITQGELT